MGKVGVGESGASAEWVRVGDRIRVAREAAKLSVRELARRVDVSSSHVSQVERGLASFSVRALYNVVSVLGISMDSLFEEAPAGPDQPPASAPGRAPAAAVGPLDDGGIVLRRATRPTIALTGGTRWERLTPRPEVGAEFIEVVYPPNPQATPPPKDFIRHSSREYGIVVQGALTVQVGFDQTVLHTGDSIAFDSHIPHRFWNATADEVRAIWFIQDDPRGGESNHAHD
ncbi:helix-turn-helix domain-containing protein [Micromonospora sp. CA-263727]|uniref:helix-turn-helix domain-containing protein n=1 Tax=Micromonospora sp. CA-263727 TaxID=3239967 RepID=UPI003D8C0109